MVVVYFFIVNNIVVIVIDSSFFEQIEKTSIVAIGILLYKQMSI
jgi:hypothetical protein